MQIIVVCGAGASSTFIALRVRRSAASRGLDVTAKAIALDNVDDALADADVLLLGAHLAESASDLERTAKKAGTALAVMPESVFTAPKGDDALDLALTAAGANS
ncbi:PTS sugar transporter subunit IIB [Paramicrobacterium chengjingii]|uniref:PTS IIB subunit n=1 Tax=Paramicrobacterium chengjingii TaxID=2769067 RepID=A0ABX6YLD3_9MICO|nr:hypothetical protein [Microbacterium chengjingii]QPZ39152.1 PTS IIB subunit [Microbacterium chengjingii]